jgi:hypothetical protein
MPSINLGTMTFSNDALEAAQNYLRSTATPLTNSLVANIAAGALSMQLENATGIALNDVLAIDNEFITVTNIGSAPTYPITRASLLTTAAAHTGRVANTPNTGAVVKKVSVKTFQEMAKNILNQTMGRMVVQYPPASVTAQKDAIDTANSTISGIASTSVT